MKFKSEKKKDKEEDRPIKPRQVTPFETEIDLTLRMKVNSFNFAIKVNQKGCKEIALLDLILFASPETKLLVLTAMAFRFVIQKLGGNTRRSFTNLENISGAWIHRTKRNRDLFLFYPMTSLSSDASIAECMLSEMQQTFWCQLYFFSLIVNKICRTIKAKKCRNIIINIMVTFQRR